MEKDKVFFKIVIPNYNNMAYIKKCFDSIINQTFQDFKIIIVDDLSTDLSDKFALAYSHKYANKIIYAQLLQKGYAGAARNFGIEYPNLESEYTWFIDSDDWLASDNVLMNMYKKIIHDKFPDILRCSYIDYGKIKRYVKLNSNENDILKDGAAPFKTCIKSKFDIHFIENRSRNNDVIWFMKLMDTIDFNKISSIQSPCCVYNRSSITSCQNNEYTMIKKSYVDADRALVEDLKKLDVKKEKVQQRKLRVLERYANKYKDPISVDELLKYSLVISIDKDRYISMHKLFKTYGFKIFPDILFGSTFKNRSGQFNCKHSHMRAVQYAKSHKWPYILIFEDDAYPCDNILQKLNTYLYALPKDASLIVLGWSHSYMQKFNKPFNKISETAISGSHAYLVFEQAYDRFISYHMNNPNKSADNTVFKTISPSYIIDQPLFIQYTSSKSMNGHVGFAYYGNHKNPPNGFSLVNI